MRTSHSSSPRAVAGLSLTDFGRAVSAAPSPALAPAIDVAAGLAPEVPAALLASAVETLEAALAGRQPIDPMPGPSLSRLVSAVNATAKRSAPLIEQAIVAGLEQAGFVVFRHVAMPVSAAARSLVAFNEMRTLRGVSVAADEAAEGSVIVFDLLVYCPRRKRATLIEVKRGNGLTELRKIKPITLALKAGSLQLRGHFKAMGLTARQVDARLIDYYGRSGFDDEVRITGDEVDRYFGAPIRTLVERVLAEMRKRVFAALPGLLAQAMAEAAQGPEPGPRLITLRDGIRVAPEHLRQIELPPRRRGKPKLAAKVIAIGGSRRPGGPAPATVR